MPLLKITREVTIPIAQYHNDKIFVSIEEDVKDVEKSHEKYSKLLSGIIKMEYKKIKEEAEINKQENEPNVSNNKLPNYKPF